MAEWKNKFSTSRICEQTNENRFWTLSVWWVFCWTPSNSSSASWKGEICGSSWPAPTSLMKKRKYRSTTWSTRAADRRNSSCISTIRPQNISLAEWPTLSPLFTRQVSFITFPKYSFSFIILFSFIFIFPFCEIQLVSLFYSKIQNSFWFSAEEYIQARIWRLN